MNLPTTISYYQEKERTTHNGDNIKKYQFSSQMQQIMIQTKLMNHKKRKHLMKKQSLKKIIEIKKVNNDTKQSDKIIMLSPFIPLREIVIQIISLFLEDFDRYSLSQTCLTMKKIFKSKNFYLFIEKEEHNINWNSCEADKRWINVENYGIKFKDQYETMQYFTEGWNRNKFLEDKFHVVCYHRLCPTVKDNNFTTEAKVKYCLNLLNECLLQLKDRYKSMFSETKEMNKEVKDKEYYMNIQNGKRQIRKEIQILYYYNNCLSSNDIYDAAMRHHFVGQKFDKDLHNQCECPLNIWSYKWRKMFNLPHFECTNHLMKPQGLIDHLYARAFSGCIYHMATFYYLFEIYDGKEDVKRVSNIFFPNNSV